MTISYGLGSDRPVAVDCDAVHYPALAMIIVQRIVLHAAIVPERDRALLPAEAAGEFRPDRVLPEEVQQWPALLDRHVLEADREIAVDVEAFPEGHGMGAHHRMLGLAMRRLAAQNVHRREPFEAGVVVISRGVVDIAGAVDRDEPVEHPLHPRRQRLIGHVLVGEHRVAAIIRDLKRVEDRAERRRVEIGHVGMPAAAEIVGVLLVFGDDEDFRMAGHRLDELVHVERAEAPAERQMPLRRQMLVAEEDDAMVEQRLVHVGGGRIVELARQINPSTIAPSAPLIGFASIVW